MTHFAKKGVSGELFFQSSSETAHFTATMQRELGEQKKRGEHTVVHKDTKRYLESIILLLIDS